MSRSWHNKPRGKRCDYRAAWRRRRDDVRTLMSLSRIRGRRRGLAQREHRRRLRRAARIEAATAVAITELKFACVRIAQIAMAPPTTVALAGRKRCEYDGPF